ncbi:hypothetical protein KJ966_02170 [bacterium]|nr:hypothetical protein [bacterium]
MGSTFADTLEDFCEYFPTSLISTAGFFHLSKIVEKFPPLMLPGIGFESRLYDKNPSLDLFFSIEKEFQDKVGLPEGLNFNESLFSHFVWQNILHFCKQWSVPGSVLEKSINTVFFEFDVGDSIADIPVPAVFLQLNDSMYRVNPDQQESNFKKLIRPDCDWVFEFLSLLKNRTITSATKDSAWRCFASLPPGTIIDHAAIMLSRTPDVMRLNVAHLSEELLYDYLEKIGLGHRILDIQPRLSTYCGFIDHMVLALDVGEEIYPRIGIELRMPKIGLELATQKNWYPFLDYLVKENLCTKEKRDGLVSWSGRSRDIYDPVLYKYMIYRHINFFKAVFEPDQPPRLKAYFSLVFQEMKKS